MQLGINGSGFFENLDTPSEDLIKSLGDVHIRFPGGSISRFHEPFSVRKGWGLTTEKVNQFFDNYQVGADEDDPNGGREKWLQKVNEQPNHSYMDDLIRLSNEMPGLSVIYVINVFTSTVTEQLNTINYLISNGVRIPIVEFGNEVYGKYEFDTTNYIAFCSEMTSLLKQSRPEIKVSLISGNFKGRRDHEQWNTQLANYVNVPENKVDYVTLHFYIGSDLAPSAFAALPAPKVVDYTTTDVALSTACENYADEVIYSERFQQEIDVAKAIYNVPVIVTEWNNNPAASWCNTWINAWWIFQTYANLDGVDVLCLHNGVSPDIYGAICRKKQQDDYTGEMVPRTSYHALKLVSEYYNAVKSGAAEGEYIFTPEFTGKFIVPMVNFSGFAMLLNLENPAMTDLKLRVVTGKYPYSSSGATGFQAKNQPKNMEISGIAEYSITNPSAVLLPAYSFGYLTGEVVEKHVAPVADAGYDKMYRITTGNTAAVTLDASKSRADEGLASITWDINGSTYFYPTIQDVVVNLPEGVYTATLTVTDVLGQIATDTCTVTVKKKKKYIFNFRNPLNAKNTDVA